MTFLQKAALFFQNILEKNILKKKAPVPQNVVIGLHYYSKVEYLYFWIMVLPQWQRFQWIYFWIMALPNDVAEHWAFFFGCLRAKSGISLRIDEHRIFLVPTSTVLCHSAPFCAVCFGAALGLQFWTVRCRIMHQLFSDAVTIIVWILLV